MKNKKLIIFVALITILVVGVIIAICILLKSDDKTKSVGNGKKEETTEVKNQENVELIDEPSDIEDPILTSEGIEVVPTMNDKIDADSSWCGTFQLVWNDMKNEIVGKDVEFSPQIEMVKNLNKEDFTDEMISEDYYFKKYGTKTQKTKKEIEEGIKEKFDQESDILDDIEWSKDNSDDEETEISNYIFYTMLYREFQYNEEFNKLDNGQFGDKYDNVEYFGINGYTNSNVKKQVKVLYYNDKDDFAVAIQTKDNDEVILCKNPQGNTFNEIYDTINEKAEKFEGKKELESDDIFKAPNLRFNKKKEYKELQEKEFETKDGNKATMEKAIQTIQFEIDENGGKVKSEAVIDVDELDSNFIEEKKNYRNFYIDDTFAIFLKEKEREKPYFAARVDDITKFQTSAKKIVKEGEETSSFDFDKLFTNKVKNYNEKYENQKEKNAKDIVYTGYQKEEQEENCYDINAQIPYINVKGESIKQYNEDIKKTFEKRVEAILSTKDKNFDCKVDYGAYIEDDILSVIVRTKIIQENNRKLIIKTYNYNLKDEKEVSLEDVLESNEIDQNDVKDKIAKVIKEQNKKAKELEYEVYERDEESEEYNVENIKNYYICNGNICLIFAYGNTKNTTEKDIVVIPVQ